MRGNQLEVEVFETDLGLFKATAQNGNGNLVFVQTYLVHSGAGYWEDVGYMKRKDFLNLIKPHNPKKKELDSINSDSFWEYYGVTKF